jgi:hypothetical protein
MAVSGSLLGFTPDRSNVMAFARRNFFAIFCFAFAVFSLMAEVTPAGVVDNLRQWNAVLANLISLLKDIMATHGLTLFAAIIAVISALQLWRDWRRSKEVESLVNPSYDSDMMALDGQWLISAVINRETVLIVTADTVIGELLDRPTAVRIRDEINRKGGSNRFRRAIIVGEHVLHDPLTRDSVAILGGCPWICIGSARINPASAIVIGTPGTTFPLASGQGHYVTGPPPRVAIWGTEARDTHAAAVAYISSPRGLREFLRNCWR